MTSLTIRGVTRSFGPTQVLAGVDLQVPERTVTAVLGPSGCGKTTLLLAPVGTITLATEFWQQSNSLAYGAAAPYAALMVLLSAPATLLLTREARTR